MMTVLFVSYEDPYRVRWHKGEKRKSQIKTKTKAALHNFQQETVMRKLSES
jgi:hypothetical protein